VRVLDFFLSTPNACSIQGNHERKHFLSFHGKTRPALSQQITRRQFGEDRYPDAVSAMDSFPRALDLDDALLVHGFFEPGVPLAEQRETVLVGTLTGEGYLEKRLTAPWYELYDGPRPIIVGHRDYLHTGQPLIHRDRVWGIDTGCCRGSRLTGLVLPGFKVLSVPARRNWWSEAQEQGADLRLDVRRDEALSWDEMESLARALAARTDPRTQARLERVRGLLAAGAAGLDRLFEHVHRENDRILATLRQRGAFDSLTAQEQGRRYAPLVPSRGLAPLLHAARKGKLASRDDLRRHFATPVELAAFLDREGLAALPTA
jgi:hypothetical protein